jgi:Tfp pilus assembly protein PilF
MAFKRHLRLFLNLLPVLLLFGLSACRSGEKLPEKSSAEYRALVSAFYIGLAALQVGDDARADAKLKQATELAPDEAAGWADWGLLALRRREFDAAAERLEKARSLAPDNAQIYVLLGVLESSRGRLAEAIAHLRRAVELSPKDLKALYMLASEVERAGGESSEAEAQGLLEKILTAQPNNLAALLEVTRLAAKRGDAETLRKTVARIGERASSWPAEIREQFDALQSAANSSNPRQAATRVAFLRNVLARDAEYRRSLNAIKTPPEVVGEPLTRFVKLESPTHTPAPPDESLSFNTEPLADVSDGQWEWCGAISLTGEGMPALMYANGREVQIAGGAKFAFPGGKTAAPPVSNGVLVLDYNYDFKTDLALAGAGGFRLFKQGDSGAFANVTTETKLSSAVTNAAYTGAWAADIELDGELDIVLAKAAAAPLVLQNNGDGTFKEIHPFADAKTMLDFAWADLDSDGDPDAVLLSDGQLQVYANERGGQFRPRTMPANQVPIRAFGVADINSDGILDLLALQANGVLARLSDKGEGREWETAEVARLPGPPDNYLHQDGRLLLLLADMDNNGGLDIVMPSPIQTAGQDAAGNSWGWLIWLNDEKGGYKLLQQPNGARVFSIADFNADGRLDFAGVATDGKPVKLINKGTKNYHWQVVRPRAQGGTGDQRINSFGIGGEMEVRAGLLVQRQAINSPLMHFGLGENAQADIVRVVWPNGTAQAEFEFKADQAVAASQRLKGSCPWVYAYDGTEVRFITDFIWRSPLGLKINAQETAGVAMTEEWIRIRGDQLAPRDGFYDIRITAELWESHFFDQVSLMVVDHPAGTEIFVDERFAIPPPPLIVHPMAAPQPVKRAWDDLGRDVTEFVNQRDERYLDTFGRGAYQGVTRDHYVEVELPDDAPRDGMLWLVCEGWIHPTDSSINVAISQGGHEPPHGLSMEVPDGKGGWTVAKPNLGFPAGKSKTVLLDLSGVFREGTPRRLRLRTNLEIYWDAIQWAVGQPQTELKTLRLDPATVELRYRGFSFVNQADKSSPELPDYNRLAGTMAMWRDLVGYHTRFGDVRDLLTKVDDRYVIMNAGDEMLFRFAAAPPVPAGWVRDYVLIGDGWEKDGDYNTGFSKTVLPLPTHATSDYTKAPARLEDDPVYRRYPQDWQDYHTRYVTPQSFADALRVK